MYRGGTINANLCLRIYILYIFFFLKSVTAGITETLLNDPERERSNNSVSLHHDTAFGFLLCEYYNIILL